MSKSFIWQLDDLVTNRKTNIYKSKLKLGRSKDLDLTCVSVAASRKHAEFTLCDDGQVLMVTDLKSMNGVFVNKKRIPAGVPHVLHDNDEIGIAVDEPLEDKNTYFKVRKRGLIEGETVIVVDNSDEECTANNELPLNNSRSASNDDSIPASNNRRPEPNDSRPAPTDNEPATSDNSSLSEMQRLYLLQYCNVTDSNHREINSPDQNDRNGMVVKMKGEKEEGEVSGNEESEHREDEIRDSVSANNQAVEQDYGESLLDIDVTLNPAGDKRLENFELKIDIDEENPELNTDLGIKEEVEHDKIKVEPHLDDELVVVIDSDDDDVSTLSQVLAGTDSVKNGNAETPVKEIDIFDKIKKEVSDMDRVEDPEDYDYPLLLDSDHEDLSDIFAEELKEYELRQKQTSVTSPTLPTPPIENTHVSYNNDLGIRSPPPSSSRSLIPNGNAILTKPIQRTNSIVLIEAQPLKTHNRKRKSDAKTNSDEPSRKQKTTSKSRKFGHLENNKKTDDRPESKEEKNKISQLRKGKLKELAVKATENKSAESKPKTRPKVKVSESRGMFLLNAIEPSASTSKTKDATVSKTIKNGNLTNKPSNLPITSTIQTIPLNEYIQVDTMKEVAEIVAWNTNWLTRNEHLAYLNPVVRLKKLKRLEATYSSYQDYFEMNRSLLMVEVWAHLQKEFEVNRSNLVFPMFIEDCDRVKYADVWSLSCLTYLTQLQAEAINCPKESDIIVMDLRVEDNKRIVLKPTFGYVKEITRCVLRNHHYINTKLAEKLDSAPHTKLAFKVFISKCLKELKVNSIVNFKVITSLVSHLRLFKSLRSLEHSPLLNLVLKPKLQDYKLPDVVSHKLVSKDHLSDVQLCAVMEAVYVCLRREPGLYLLQGPPGTGKTTVIKNIVLQMLYGEHRAQNGCILLVAPSNAAVDQLVLKLVNEARPKLTGEQKREMKLIRVGPASSIHANVRPYCLEHLAKKNLKKDLLSDSTEACERNQELLEEIYRVEREIQTLKGRHTDVTLLKKKLQTLQLRSDNFARELLKERYYPTMNVQYDALLSGAKIICTTLSSCMGKKIEENVLSGKLRFVCCIVDEATQSTEQETLIPVRLGIKRMILVGDPQQLPATVMSGEAKKFGYGSSLFQRILKNFECYKSKPVKMLNVQFRMHPEICKFPNEQYYRGELKSAGFKYLKPLEALEPFLIFSLANKNINQRIEPYKSTEEACFIYKLIEALFDCIPATVHVTVGIITPYQTQRAAIHSMLKSVEYRDHISIECNTVDSFQGRETDISILSCVREDANSFVNDAHRLNVALTRAKYALYVVGAKSLFDSCVTLEVLRRNAKNRYLLRDGTHLKTDDLKPLIWDRRKK